MLNGGRLCDRLRSFFCDSIGLLRLLLLDDESTNTRVALFSMPRTFLSLEWSFLVLEL